MVVVYCPNLKKEEDIYDNMTTHFKIRY